MNELVDIYQHTSDNNYLINISVPIIKYVYAIRLYILKNWVRVKTGD